ncbi:hypothetical protein GQ53DRAFT_835170 [Thozetella sp. PMI_491]|nr:hypothetical protein GQ53DRAFT_835170 [Thozetella sp. PMI_491]
MEPDHNGDIEVPSQSSQHISTLEFVKHPEPCIYELFFDLWFVASFEVFNEIHKFTDASKLYTYIGYVCILWFTWASVGFYDVRFVTDSVFDRLTRLCHLGVMVGFSVVAPQFDPYDQRKDAFEATSFILAFSRLILTIQYLSVLWHIRHYREGRLAIATNAAWHFIFAVVAFGIGFRFEEGKNSRVYIAWYIISAVEAIGTLAMSLYRKWENYLSFNGSHLTERMTTLTLIIIGERVISVATSISHIVQNEGWTKSTIGILIADIIAIYVLFMIYFDWQDYKTLEGVRQVVWALLTFPFHATLLLFFTGTSQFVLWWKVYEVRLNISGIMSTSWNQWLRTNHAGTTTQAFVTAVNNTMLVLFSRYQPPDDRITEELEPLLNTISTIPQGFWNSELDQKTYDGYLSIIQQSWNELQMIVVHAVYTNFEINLAEESRSDDAVFQTEKLEFQYSYATGGIMIILMIILLLLTKQHRGTVPFYARISVVGLLGIAMALYVLLSTNEERLHDFLDRGAAVPVLMGVFIVILLLTHIPGPSFGNVAVFIRTWRNKASYPRYKPEKVVQQPNRVQLEPRQQNTGIENNVVGMVAQQPEQSLPGSVNYSGPAVEYPGSGPNIAHANERFQQPPEPLPQLQAGFHSR